MATTSGTQIGQPTAACSICGGSGWRLVEVPDRPSITTRCQCFIARRSERLLESARIPLRYHQCSLSSFNAKHDLANEGGERSLARALLAAGHFVENYPLEKEGLLFTGPIGTGKTHLAVGIIRELTSSKNVPCLFCDYRELLKEIQHSYNPNVDATELGILTPVLDAEVLVLDELGAIRPSQWVWDTVSYVINYRYNEKKTTIITTNYPDLPSAPCDSATEAFSASDRAKAVARTETLGDRITDRMRSRLHEMCRIIQLEGEDYRMKILKQF